MKMLDVQVAGVHTPLAPPYKKHRFDTICTCQEKVDMYRTLINPQLRLKLYWVIYFNELLQARKYYFILSLLKQKPRGA